LLFDKIRKSSFRFLYHSAPHEPGRPLLRVERLSVEYQSGLALDDINFEIQAGERLAVVGPNGAGKSTLFKVIAGVLRPSQGLVEIAGHEPGGHNCIAYVPQRSQVDWNFPATVADVVMMGRIAQIGYLRWPTARDWQLVREMLNMVNLEAYAKRQIGQLSGGQQQRMFIARALAQEAQLILMDEPLSGLDLPAQEDIFQIMDALREQKVTIMVAMHDLETASNRFERVMLLNRRLIGIGRPEEVFSTDSLLKAYGGHLRLVPTPDGLAALSDSCCDEGDHPHA
jgi:manganese/iron transport system ATP-binding protein